MSTSRESLSKPMPPVTRIPYRSLLTREMTGILEGPGLEMEKRTGMLLYMLEDDRYYTIREAVESQYSKERDPILFKKLYNRLNHFASHCSLTKSPDTRVGKAGVCAWWGRTLKEQMGLKSYYRAQLNYGLLNVLRARIGVVEQNVSEPPDLNRELAELRAYAQDLKNDAVEASQWVRALERRAADGGAPGMFAELQDSDNLAVDLEKSFEVHRNQLEKGGDHTLTLSRRIVNEDPNPKISQKRSPRYLFRGRGIGKPFSRVTMVALPLMLFSMVFVYAFFKIKPLEQSAQGSSIVVVPCLEDEMATALTEMVTQGLEHSRAFLPVEYTRAARYRLSGCQRPEWDVLGDVAESLNARFILIGTTETRANGYLYRGVLFRNDGKRRAIHARGDHYRTLSDAVVRQCLAWVGSDEEPPSAVELYSANSSASLMYSEGKIFFQKGNIAVARALFERAGSEYDPSFYLARNYWARCLEISGDLPKAREVLEAIQAHPPAGIMPATLIQTYRFLASVYYENHETGKLSDLLMEVSGLPLTPDDELYFLRVEAELRLVEGDSEKARLISGQARDLAGSIQNQNARISTLITASWVASRDGDHVEGFALLEEALEIARVQKLISREIDIQGEKARLLIKIGDKPGIEEFIDELTEIRETARSFGNNWDGVKIDYWLGRLMESLGRGAEGRDYLVLVAKDAESLGILEYEVKAKLRLVSYYKEKQITAEARRTLNSLKSRASLFAPHYRLLVLEELAAFYFSQNEFHQAISALNQKIELTAHLEHPDHGRTLQNKGFVLEAMGRLNDAEQQFLNSLEYKTKHGDPSIKTTLSSLVRVYSKLGRVDLAKKYEAILISEQ